MTFQLTVPLVVGLSLYRWVRVRRQIGSTTLTTAWRWGLAAHLLWLCVWSLDELIAALTRGSADRMWYCCGLVMLCAPMAVLGAKRPGARVWAAFVLVPMLLVLGWPAFAVSNVAALRQPLELDSPAVVAWALVLVMGAGNYLGTRLTGTALCGSAAVIVIMLPLSVTADVSQETARLLRISAAYCLCLGTWLIPQARNRDTGVDPLDVVWLDFRDAFGIVWSRRILERVNHTAISERWPVRLTMQGFLSSPRHGAPESVDTFNPASLSEAERHRVEHILRWLLRRFVDQEWIDARLAAAATTSATAPRDHEFPSTGFDRQGNHRG